MFKRMAAVVLPAALALGVGPAAARPTGAGTAASTVTVWVGWSGRELSAFKTVVAGYAAARPGVAVTVVGGVNDDTIAAAIHAGRAPDVVSSFTSQNVAGYCSSGDWIDLAPYLRRSGLGTSIFPKAARSYTRYGGTRCALPLLADTYGLYYNTKLLQQAGIPGPPRTFEELTADARKLTKRNPDGSLRTVGFDPLFGFYENSVAAYQPLFGGRYFTPDGTSSLAADPSWARFLAWQKSLVDLYGYRSLLRWQAAVGDEFSAAHAFETGRLAMMLDGEWRVGLIAAEHPELRYATAPMPALTPGLYGAGYVNGAIVGIPNNGGKHDAAWDLVRYLTTDDHALAALADGTGGVPSTASAATSTALRADPRAATFARILTNPGSQTLPVTAIGAAHLDTLQRFLVLWQSGRVRDLAGGLAEVDRQIDARLKQAAGG